MRCTLFPNLRATRGRRYELTWQSLFDRFHKPRIVEAKEALPLWLPGTLVDDDRSADRARLEEAFACVLDFDDGPPVGRALELLGDLCGLVHTTFSHAGDAACYRAILPLSRTVGADEYPAVWRAAEAMCCVAGVTPDPACKNPTRIWFLPGHRPGAPFECHELEGALLDPDELVSRWPEPEAQIDPWPFHPHSRDDHHGSDVSGDERSRRIRRAEAYVARMPPSIAGERGDDALWRVALVLVKGFDLEESDALALLRAYNARRARPRWSEGRLHYKIRQAGVCSNLPRGYLLDRGAA